MDNDRHKVTLGDPSTNPCALYAVRGSIHRHLATIGDAVLLVEAASHRVFLSQRADGSVGLPSVDQVDGMMTRGEMTALDDDAADDEGLARMELELAMLDAADVPNGVKAIWIFLNAAWDEDLRRRFGPFDDPASIRRWRTEGRRTSARGPARAPPG